MVEVEGSRCCPLIVSLRAPGRGYVQTGPQRRVSVGIVPKEVSLAATPVALACRAYTERRLQWQSLPHPFGDPPCIESCLPANQPFSPRNRGSSQVVPAAVLGGVYALRNVVDAQVKGLTLFSAHNLDAMLGWMHGMTDEDE